MPLLEQIQPMGARGRSGSTPLRELFVRRVREEMYAQELSVNALSKRVGAPRQTTLNDVLAKGADPRLETVYQTAFALGVQPWELLVEVNRAGEKIIPAAVGSERQIVVPLQRKYPTIFAAPQKEKDDRAKRRKRG